MVFDETRGAGRVDKESEREVGGRFGGGDGVEGEAGVRGEGFAGALEAWGTWWQDLEQRFWERQGFGREGFENSGEGLFLFCGRDDGGVDLAVAAEVVTVVEAADLFGRGFGLVALEEVKGDEGVFQLRDGSALGDGVFAEAFESGGADCHYPIEFVGGVGAVVPEVRVWVGAAEGA